MSRIADAFNHGKAFMAYLMAGDPDLAASAEYILAAQEAGADLIEIGIPFSDPIAEGEVIQRASARALASGTKLDGVFEMVASIQEQMRVPVVFMTYLNPVFVFGYERFFAQCIQCGVSGVIIPDLPYEEAAEVKEIASRYGIQVITLAAPTSDARIRCIAADAEGFLYLVSSLGVTGIRGSITTDIDAIVAQVRSISDIPIAVGFGISTPEQAAQYSRIADGVIVGSAIVNIVEQHGKQAAQSLKEYIAAMKAAQRGLV